MNGDFVGERDGANRKRERGRRGEARDETPAEFVPGGWVIINSYSFREGMSMIQVKVCQLLSLEISILNRSVFRNGKNCVQTKSDDTTKKKKRKEKMKWHKICDGSKFMTIRESFTCAKIYWHILIVDLSLGRIPNCSFQIPPLFSLFFCFSIVAII